MDGSGKSRWSTHHWFATQKLWTARGRRTPHAVGITCTARTLQRLRVSYLGAAFARIPTTHKHIATGALTCLLNNIHYRAGEPVAARTARSGPGAQTTADGAISERGRASSPAPRAGISAAAKPRDYATRSSNYRNGSTLADSMTRRASAELTKRTCRTTLLRALSTLRCVRVALSSCHHAFRDIHTAPRATHFPYAYRAAAALLSSNGAHSRAASTRSGDAYHVAMARASPYSISPTSSTTTRAVYTSWNVCGRAQILVAGGRR